jgi:hypothetical protein
LFEVALTAVLDDVDEVELPVSVAVKDGDDVVRVTTTVWACDVEALLDAVTMEVTSWVDGGADEAVEVDVATVGDDEDEMTLLDERLVVVEPPAGEETVEDDASEDCDKGADDAVDDDMMASKRK